MKDLYSKNYKTLKKFEDNGKMERYEYTIQNNLQIQCNPYQATNGIFHRTRTNNFTICMEIQKP